MMKKKFEIASDVAKSLPEMRIVVVTATGIDNATNNTKVEQYAKVCELDPQVA